MEEAIRFASPVRHFVRTAKVDFELRGQTIRAGQSAILWYPSGSRDESVFEFPDTFSIDREKTARHAAFGHGTHMCLGMHLARQENISFLKTFAPHIEEISLSGPPRHIQANFVGGIKSLPIRATLATRTAAAV